MKRLYKSLKEYENSDFYGFHMPGHKRNTAAIAAELPYGIDITEIEGFDDLHHAHGILKEAQERAARVFGAEETHYLVNGSTAGLLSAVMGCTCRRGDILVARNCHKSVYNAIFLHELHPVYVYPRITEEIEINQEISSEEIDRLLCARSEIQAVVITSPTYDGVVSDIKGIAEVVHKRGIPLIVDEAHGAHFGFHPYFPENANKNGADVVIHSLHKTLPALTQSALLHINGSLVNRRKVREYLRMFQTSSPSYVLMAGIDECVWALENERERLFAGYTERLERIRRLLEGLEHIKLLATKDYDRSKIVLSVRNTRRKGEKDGFCGQELYSVLLEKYHLQMEMAAGSYVVAMTSPADTEEGMERLVIALREIDRELECVKPCEYAAEISGFPRQRRIWTSYEAEELRQIAEKAEKTGKQEMRKEQVVSLTGAQMRSGEKDKLEAQSVPWSEAVGKAALEYVYVYPPGIPVIVPGEQISDEAVRQVVRYEKMGFSIEGIKEKGRIEVLKNG